MNAFISHYAIGRAILKSILFAVSLRSLCIFVCPVSYKLVTSGSTTSHFKGYVAMLCHRKMSAFHTTFKDFAILSWFTIITYASDTLYLLSCIGRDVYKFNFVHFILLHSCVSVDIPISLIASGLSPNICFISSCVICLV